MGTQTIPQLSDEVVVRIHNQMNVVVKAFFVSINYNILVVSKTGCIQRISDPVSNEKRIGYLENA